VLVLRRELLSDALAEPVYSVEYLSIYRRACYLITS